MIPLERPAAPPAAAAAPFAHRVVVAAVALLATGLSLLISSAVLDRIPHVTDGVSYAFQGKILAGGHLFLPPPAVPELFVHENIVLNATRWCSLYPPGWPLLLALGWWLGAPWVLDPILLGLSVIGVWRLGRALFDSKTGLLAAVVLAVSPFALLMSAGFMAHGPAMCAAVWCLAMLAESAPRSTAAGTLSQRRSVAAGFLGGYALLIRPFTAVALLAPAVIWAVSHGRSRFGGSGRGSRTGSPPSGSKKLQVSALFLGSLPCAIALLLYNRAVFGGALTSGYAIYDTSRFGAVASMTESPISALGSGIPWYLASLNRSLWGLPFGDLLIFVPLLWPRPRGSGRGRDLMLAACAASLVLGHSFYYYRSTIYSGPRLAFEALAPLALLAARSLMALGALLQALLARLRSDELRRPVRLAILGVGSAALLYFPLGHRLPEQMIRHAQWYMFVGGEPMEKAAAVGVGRDALVFVAGSPEAYPTFFLENDFTEAHGRVFVRDIPPLRAAAVRAYPRREIWQVNVVIQSLDPVLLPEFGKAQPVTWTRLQ